MATRLTSLNLETVEAPNEPMLRAPGNALSTVFTAVRNAESG